MKNFENIGALNSRFIYRDGEWRSWKGQIMGKAAQKPIFTSYASDPDTVVNITWTDKDDSKYNVPVGDGSSRKYILDFGHFSIYRIFKSIVDGKQNSFDTYNFVLN